jgi:hypothetical protein
VNLFRHAKEIAREKLNVPKLNLDLNDDLIAEDPVNYQSEDDDMEEPASAPYTIVDYKKDRKDWKKPKGKSKTGQKGSGQVLRWIII